jgi:hypothetical protein
VSVLPRSHAGPDTSTPSRRNNRSWWPTVVSVLLVLGCATLLLVLGYELHEALLGGAGVALSGNEVARRIITDASPWPTVVVGSAVAAFGAVLIALGYSVFDAALGAGVSGVVAGAVAGRFLARPQLAGTGGGSR